ncbi:hypothetical protein KHP62_09745 [Rhodobacteraceae bacterium NNCM2]|nr:hypothetical protein [Coraliihabitans acroporae]
MSTQFSRFSHEIRPGIGHNKGPSLQEGGGFRRYAWKKARAELVPKLPLEVVRRRVARARELGLEYPQYASILLGTGRDIVAFLFTSEAIGLRVGRGDLSEAARQKLAAITRCDRLLMTPSDADAGVIGRLLAERQHVVFAQVGNAPQLDASLRDGRSAVRAILDPMKLAGDQVVMIGTEVREREWADAARLARFLPAERFFPEAGSNG